MAHIFSKVVSLCKRRGFLLELPKGHSGHENAYVYGPLGAELKKNIINEWWHAVVTSSSNIYGIDSNTLTQLPITDDTSTTTKTGHEESAPETSSSLEASSSSSVEEESKSNANNLYQWPSINGGLVCTLEAAKCLSLKPPYGIAAVGKMFQTKSSPQYPIHLSEALHTIGDSDSKFIACNDSRLQDSECMGVQFVFPSSEERKWYSHWQKKRLRWWRRLSKNPENFSLGEESREDEDSRQQCSIQYEFPWGSQDMESVRSRGDGDLKQLLESDKLTLGNMGADEEKLPFLISFAAGIDRAVFAYLCDAYNELQRPHTSITTTHTVLKLHTSLTPYKVAVLPADENNNKLCMYCRMLSEELKHAGVSTVYTETGSFESRLTTQDEVGTPYRVIADGKTLETGIVALQDRDTTGEEDMNGRDVLPSIQRMLFGARIN